MHVPMSNLRSRKEQSMDSYELVVFFTNKKSVVEFGLLRMNYPRVDPC